ncbi:hypothetical protein D3C78_1851740 [compost metagenome]
MDEDATLFMPMLQLPKSTPRRPAGHQPAANPLRAAAQKSTAPAEVARPSPNRLLLALLVLAIAVAAAMAAKVML